MQAMQKLTQWLLLIIKVLQSANSYRNLARAIWLFFPSFIFLAFTYLAFWTITQGRDLMLFTMQKPNAFLFFILTQVFWSYMAWYSSRLVAKAKFWEDNNYFFLPVRVHLPRLLGFSSFTIMILALLQINDFPWHISRATAGLLLLASIPYYLLLHKGWNYLITVKQYNPANAMKAAGLALLVSLVGMVFFRNAQGLVFLFLEMQFCFVLLVVARRKRIEQQQPDVYARQLAPYNYDNASGLFLLYKKMKRLFLDKEDMGYFITFNIIGIGVFIVYLFALNSVRFSVTLGTVPVVLIAFGILVGFINFIAAVSVFARFNFHIIILALAFISGSFKEQYRVSLPGKKAGSGTVRFSGRQPLQEYFGNWLAQRDSLIRRPGKKFPIYIVLANGGASRSGYWDASVLGQLQDDTYGNFSNHLLCLSGASGGSVGNATFFSLLMNQKNMPRKGDSSFRSAGQEYLQADFLSHTLAYMLGPDFFQHVIPFINWKNREDALASSMEKAPSDSSFLFKKMDTTFTAFMSREGDAGYRLPILFINTTRMQDGRPAVISNILVDSSTFNKRVDVLNLLQQAYDMKLSTAVVLGASFPYLSPAGRIDELRKNHTIRPHYFVDGGYFDNSGAGVVNEMLIAIKKMLADTCNTNISPYQNYLDFYIIHILNDPIGEPRLDTLNSLTNDLAAPVKTLYGAYGTQTVVNDLRLVKFISDWYNNNDHYQVFNLYKSGDPASRYSMNWVISAPVLSDMRRRLRETEMQQKIKYITIQLSP
jgi:predicted acylesterase/phospholipase RssA